MITDVSDDDTTSNNLIKNAELINISIYFKFNSSQINVFLLNKIILQDLQLRVQCSLHLKTAFKLNFIMNAISVCVNNIKNCKKPELKIQ
ncbi:hypothetical protein T4B_11558 [Trichinella pseudospiralis]|uniref:Uncharacterized protein n=1 Tax=Trichinella pseudospiralis TaxID=6337 RepID=A0A0V1JQ58_TRIPS|nr:hypothetical protein T4B_11558 [Trichinella pseudospiralis]KRZ37083.1 hypothetical protein T4C_4342 [Trichinella pseudospiralis]